MARLFEVDQLEAKKRALITEAEVYRQTLALEIQNLRHYRLGAERRLKQFSGLFMLIPLGGSLLGMISAALFRRKRRSKLRRWLPTALMGWRFYRKFGPMLQPLVARFMAGRAAGSRAEDRTPAANI
jgi:hypothetical protein